MTKKFLPAAALFVLFAAFSVFSQDKPANYSGNWKLDLAKSEMGERSRVESMDMTVGQTADELAVDRKPKLAEAQGGGMGRGGLGGGGKLNYSLSGKETKAAAGGPGGEVALKAKVEKGGKLQLTQTRNLETQMGAMTIKTVETWELSADGKTLTVSSATETPRGSRNQKMVFVLQ